MLGTRLVPSRSRSGSSGCTGRGCLEVLQWGQDSGGTGTTAGYGMYREPGAQFSSGLGHHLCHPQTRLAVRVLRLSLAPWDVQTGDAPPPPRPAPGATSGLGCRQSPGHPAAHTPDVPRRGMGINRKPSTPAVPRDRPGMCRWPPDCLFGVKAAGSCREEPGSTRPGIARELIATSRKDFQHLWVWRDAQLCVPLEGDPHPSRLPWP